MAFNNVGHAFLASGASGRYWVERNGGADFGTQFITAEPENADAQLISSNQGKVHQGANGHWTYWVTITNWGPNATWFSLQGGGMA